ncbi:MAG: PAS domain S-box protein [Tepidisphaeraceae bacterium]
MPNRRAPKALPVHRGKDARIAGSADGNEEGLGRLAAIVESSDDAIIAKSLDGTILEWNRAAQRLFGYTSSEAIGRKITLIVPSDRLREEWRILRRLGRGKPVDHYETNRLTKDGREIAVSMSVSPLRDAAGHVIAASTIMRDVTERRRSEMALRDREERLQALVTTAADAIITIDERGIIESANPAAEQLFGYGQSELLGANVNILMPEPFHSEHEGYLRNYLRTGRAKIIGIGREVTGLRKDRTSFPMNLSVSEIRLGNRRLFTGILHDLSGRRRLERQILEAAANEQRRIGQDLHDGLCQDLIGIAFAIDAAARTLPADARQGRESMSNLSASVRSAAGQARDLARGLNPVDLKSGLWAALDSLATKVSQSFGVRCTFRWDRVAQVHEDATATHLYRIAQEAVGNAIKHGKARAIEISLAARGGTLVLAIADNGVGMRKALTDGVQQGLALGGPNRMHQAEVGMGLQTMQFRSRVIGGSFTANKRKGGGTVIVCTIRSEPVPNAHNQKPPAAPNPPSPLASGKPSRPNRRPSR